MEPVYFKSPLYLITEAVFHLSFCWQGTKYLRRENLLDPRE
ncbi:MAG: hypothetical protein Q4C96_04830 [Planctomycetia bacterium]|nr:hypothetical protein [Planctomycetia bacterium]